MREATRMWKAMLGQIAASVKKFARGIVLQIKEAWRAHRQRLADDPAYGAAFAGVVLAACELLTGDPLRQVDP